MTLVPDEYVVAPMLVEKYGPLITSIWPGASVTSDGHDLMVMVPMAEEGELVPISDAYAAARRLRLGQDVDAPSVTQWHVRGLQRDGTCTNIWLSRSYVVPDGYDETNETLKTIVPPGMMANAA